MTGAYYSENDPFCADWLRRLIAKDLIAPGEVDTRSIEDVTLADLAGFTQHHFFAGIGIWSYALRQGGWPDERPAWTGSCPCQPFSSAGKGKGFADERHLWPSWFHLVRLGRPDALFGEQVADRNGLAWLDLVQADMEAEGYAVGAVDLCAAGFGAPHRRQRLFFVAHPDDAERRPEVAGRNFRHGPNPEWNEGHGDASDGSSYYHTAGFWRPSEWLVAYNGKRRPVEPGTFPMAHVDPATMGRLRAYGNAFVAEAGAAFVRAYLGIDHS